jgi:hypothetical protein
MQLILDFLQVKNLGLSKEFVLQLFRDRNETSSFTHSHTHAHVIRAVTGTYARWQ